MKRVFGAWWVAAALLMMVSAGCGGDSTEGEGGDSSDNSAGSNEGGSGDSDTDSQASGATGGGDSSGGSVALSTDNMVIGFIGRHTDKSKDDREGTFESFTGTLTIDEESNAPTSLTLDIDTESVTTSIPNLTNHLKTPDFFNVRENPKASFASTSIEAGEGDGMFNVTGELELLGNKGTVTFPATVTGSGADMKMTAEFDIDRTAFGMDYGPDQIEKNVTIKLNVGS